MNWATELYLNQFTHQISLRSTTTFKRLDNFLQKKVLDNQAAALNAF
uniref:Transposase n=1 Tax=Heterorhabditis bacteriophora TaxID=37862 RepID=A0A1I7WH06_HETBA